MLITALKLTVKASRSKTARRAARAAVKAARENVTVDAATRAITIDAAGRSFRLDRDAFRRSTSPATQPLETTAAAEWDDFWR